MRIVCPTVINWKSLPRNKSRQAKQLGKHIRIENVPKETRLLTHSKLAISVLS
jgi:hypothetical protein